MSRRFRTSTQSKVRLRADWIRIVEAASRRASSEPAWLESIVDAAKSVLDFPLGYGIYAVAHDASFENRRVLGAATTNAAISRAGLDAVLSFDAGTFRTLHYPPRRVHTAAELTRTTPLPDDAPDMLDGYRGAVPSLDSLGVIVHPVPGVVLVFHAQVDDGLITLERGQRVALEQLSFHLESGFRLQHVDESVAEISMDGEVRTSQIESRILGIREAQSKRAMVDALDLWPALVAGRLSLVEDSRGRTKRYRAVENPPGTWSLRGFSSREIDVLSRAAHGDSTKMIAYALGLSAAVVSNALASAAAKLGVATRTELVRIAAVLTRDPRARDEAIDLTEAEREVLELLKKGLGNEAIAKLRGRSVRTIANQVASLLRKTGRGSRRALAARH